MVGKDDNIKLIDFGLSYVKRKGEHANEIAGTPFYMAPEIIKGDYGFEVDIWSLGVLLYILVSGYLPFFSDDRDEVFRKIQTADFHFDHNEFKSVSEECKTLIRKMLTLDPKKRIKGQEVITDPWFDKFLGMAASMKENPLDAGILSNLKSFKGTSKLKKAAMNMLVKMLDQTQIDALVIEFKKYDKDKTGMITVKELENVLYQDNNGIPNTEVDRIIKEVDYQGNKKINYSEFIAATIDV
jgi:calcium-dependent protein kinase